MTASHADVLIRRRFVTVERNPIHAETKLFKSLEFRIVFLCGVEDDKTTTSLSFIGDQILLSNSNNLLEIRAI